MDKIKKIIYNLDNHIPQAVNRFNDGEINSIIGKGKISRGQQKQDKRLSEKLLKALQHEQKNYWVGLPCNTCWPKNFKIACKYINMSNKYLTHAVVLINRNYKLFDEAFRKRIPHYKFHYVCGYDQDIITLEKDLNTKIYPTYVNPINAWDNYKRISEATFEKGSLVAISAGAMGRVLVYDWFKRMPGCSFFDLGSFFDPITLGVSYRYHENKLPKCKECN